MFLYLASSRASQNRDGCVDIAAERLRRRRRLLCSKQAADITESSLWRSPHINTTTGRQTGRRGERWLKGGVGGFRRGDGGAEITGGAGAAPTHRQHLCFHPLQNQTACPAAGTQAWILRKGFVSLRASAPPVTNSSQFSARDEGGAFTVKLLNC